MNDKRKEYEDTVQRPGKFEGEPAYAPYFWEQSLDGCFDIIDFANGERIDYTTIDKDDAKMFPELSGHVGEFIVLTESDQGFVHVQIVEQADIDRWEAEAGAE